ncbi:hypothetical protein U9J35_16335 [Rossellomorea aquimaris]|nr:hypothetical protein [Rossellomorea aquimaris]WRP05469.1 hypothetical protein U9J35_16335 [Rossellomorea aquimaris]
MIEIKGVQEKLTNGKKNSASFKKLFAKGFLLLNISLKETFSES